MRAWPTSGIPSLPGAGPLVALAPPVFGPKSGFTRATMLEAAPGIALWLV